MASKLRTIDLSKILAQYKKGWLALTPDNRTLVASGKSLKAVLEKAREKGIENPSLLKAAPYQKLFIGQ